MDRNNIVIIGTVMAQTVALDHYAESVERMIVSFMGMNMKIEKTGDFDLLNKKDLYKLVASNNTVITNVLSKVKTYNNYRKKKKWNLCMSISILLYFTFLILSTFFNFSFIYFIYFLSDILIFFIFYFFHMSTFHYHISLFVDYLFFN